MSLPVYQTITLTSSNIDDLESFLRPDLNGRHPIVFSLIDLNFDQQRETIGLIENYFDSEKASFKYPYPVYLVTIHEPSITHLPVVKKIQDLPKFYNQKEGRMTIKEGHVAGRNRLLQQEIKNVDSAVHQQELEKYASDHRVIWENENQIRFLKDMVGRLTKANNE